MNVTGSAANFFVMDSHFTAMPRGISDIAYYPRSSEFTTLQRLLWKVMEVYSALKIVKQIV